MRHDERAHQAGTHAPACRPAKLLFTVTRLELNSTRPRKILAKKMLRSSLDPFPILHHRFDRKGLHRTGETHALGSFAAKNPHRHTIAHKRSFNIKHPPGFLARFGVSLVDGVAF